MLKKYLYNKGLAAKFYCGWLKSGYMLHHLTTGSVSVLRHWPSSEKIRCSKDMVLSLILAGDTYF